MGRSLDPAGLILFRLLININYHLVSRDSYGERKVSNAYLPGRQQPVSVPTWMFLVLAEAQDV
jgi:hypothetical protein